MASIWQPLNKHMRIPRIYYDGELTVGNTVSLDANASKHICKVLRLEIDAKLILFNGRGKSVQAILKSSSPDAATVIITSETEEATESPLRIHLGLGISKGDRMDYAIQKAVELGVTNITPLITERTIVRLDAKRSVKRQQHWHGIILSACEQSGRSFLPQLNPVTKLGEWLSHTGNHKLVFVPDADKTLSQFERVSETSILIGPEGGLSNPEITQTLGQNFEAVQLGPRTLRTETAVVAACTALQMLWGDLA
ncbi:MAG: 16S rRNA (uracil(1498)-N(3))-methyltransferase [Thioalkalispiraceae bacterium]